MGKFGRRPSKKMRSDARRLRYESLEDRRVMSAAALTADLAGLNEPVLQTAAALMSVEDIQSLTYSQFGQLTPEEIPYLTVQQVASIPTIGWFSTIAAASRAALTPPQVQALNIGSVRTDLLTDQQVAWLTPTQIQAIDFYQFDRLNATQVPYLTLAQIQSIPDRTSLSQWSATSRAALTSAQIPGLNVATTMIDLLTLQQVGWLSTSQVQALDIYQFQYLSPAKIPLLTTAQIAAIPNPGVFGTWTAAARAALTAPQVQALNVAQVRIELLTPTQVSWLTAAQVQAIDYYQFELLTAAQIPWLTPAQIASIPNPASFTQWSAAARAALTAPQVQALNVVTVRIDLLTLQQVSYLSLAQIYQLDYYQFHQLNPNQIPLLTQAQITSIPNPGIFGQWSSAQRVALTVLQIQSLNVRELTLQLLTPQQIAVLTTAQVQSLTIYDIPSLNDSQFPLLTPAQFAAMTNPGLIDSRSDEVQRALTREQLLSMPFNALSAYMRVETTQMPPTDYHPIMHKPIGPDGLVIDAHSIGPDVFALVPLQTATHRTIASGDWSNPAIWLNGQVPAAGAKVVVSAGTTVRFNAFMSSAIKTLRIDGTLTFATNINTQLKVDTIVVYTTGRLHIGTAAAPIADNVTARVVIPDNGPIDTVWDPYLLSRGLLSRGEVRMHGRTVTPFATLAVDPMAGATTLQLTQVPVGWRVGDDLVIAGADPLTADFGADRVKILAINGTTVTVQPLSYNHNAPDGYGFTIQVANLNRNIQFVAEDPSVIQERPHIAFFDNPNVVVENVQIQGFGRTDKDKAINSPVVVGGVMQPGTGTNTRARYALHFHHTGVNPAVAPGVVRGNVVIGSPGWGYVNHQSNVVMETNVALDVVGSAFTTEDGNEIGVMRGNLALNSLGSGDFILSRRANHDWGHGGHGFWLQGPGVELIDNIAAGTRGAGFAYMTASSKNLFDTVNLTDPSIAVGKDAIPVGTVPLRPFRGNTAYAANQGLEIWFHQTKLTDGESVIENFKSWNTSVFGIQLPYSGHITVRDTTLVGSLQSFSGYGVQTNRLTHDIVLDNLRVEGFAVGVTVPPRRSTVILGGRYFNVTNLSIEKGHDSVRSVNVAEPITFVPLTPAQLAGRTPYNVHASLKFAETIDRKADSLFSADDIRIELADGSMAQLYFLEQAANYIPFPTATSIADLPAAYIGKTNLQLWQSYGVIFNGGLPPAPAVVLPGFNGLVVLGLPAPAADFDFDGDSDGADFLTWQRGLGTQAPNGNTSNGDADDDLDVDAADLAAWRPTFGAGAAVAAASMAPSAVAAENENYEVAESSGHEAHALMGAVQRLADELLPANDPSAPDEIEPLVPESHPEVLPTVRRADMRPTKKAAFITMSPEFALGPADPIAEAAFDAVFDELEQSGL